MILSARACGARRAGLSAARAGVTTTHRLASRKTTVATRHFGDHGMSKQKHSRAQVLSNIVEKPAELKELIDGVSPETCHKLAGAALKATCARPSPSDFQQMVRGMSDVEVRHLGIAALSRHLGTDMAEEFKKYDADKSGSLSRKEFKRYLQKTIGCTHAAPDGPAASQAPTKRQLLLFGVNSAIPFLVFGMLDNSIMILGGDVVDDCIGSHFQLSTIACAAVANTFADVLGISIGNTVETMTTKMGIPEANLTQAQTQMPVVRRLGLASASIGIFVGCVIGSTPLAFMDPDKKTFKEAFCSIDEKGSGEIAAKHVVKVLVAAGVPDGNRKRLTSTMEELGIVKGGKVSAGDFLDNYGKLREALQDQT